MTVNVSLCTVIHRKYAKDNKGRNYINVFHRNQINTEVKTKWPKLNRSNKQ